jgi:hypothetical protein
VVEEEIAEIESRKAVANPGYVRRGIYHEQLERYFAYFARDQVLVLESRDRMADTWAVVNQALAFLGLREYGHSGGWAPIHVGQYETAIPTAERRLLEEFYRPHNQRFAPRPRLRLVRGWTIATEPRRLSRAGASNGC